jgi:hypothetical protein
MFAQLDDERQVFVCVLPALGHGQTLLAGE